MSLIAPIRSGRLRDLQQAFGHAVHGLLGQREPIHRGRIQTIGFRRGDILGVGGQQHGGLVLQRGGDLGQRAILGGGVCQRHEARSRASGPTDFLHIFFDVLHDVPCVLL